MRCGLCYTSQAFKAQRLSLKKYEPVNLDKFCIKEEETGITCGGAPDEFRCQVKYIQICAAKEKEKKKI